MTSTAPPRPRDTQRARLYRAEGEVPPGRRLPTVADLQSYVDDVCATPWFTARFGARTYEVRPGHGHRKATATPAGVLQMPRWARSELVVLHEVAHPLVASTLAAHGPEFAGVLLALARRAIGPATAQALEDAFTRHRVRHAVPPAPAPAGARTATGARLRPPSPPPRWGPSRLPAGG